MPSDYVIPSEWLDKINSEFVRTFIRELQKTFSEDMFDHAAVSCLLGTFGWRGSLQEACKSCGIEPMYEWYRRLCWQDADGFDDRLLEIIREQLLVDKDSEAKP